MTQVAQRVLTLRPDPDEESAFASGLQLAVFEWRSTVGTEAGWRCDVGIRPTPQSLLLKARYLVLQTELTLIQNHGITVVQADESCRSLPVWDPSQARTEIAVRSSPRGVRDSPSEDPSGRTDGLFG